VTEPAVKNLLGSTVPGQLRGAAQVASPPPWIVSIPTVPPPFVRGARKRESNHGVPVRFPTFVVTAAKFIAVDMNAFGFTNR
jgi:hypothetical protein